jgi:formate/nitrite transporter FocA (FNT family)
MSEKDSKLVAPDGSDIEFEHKTARALERKDEDQQYVPVIIKRIDQSSTHPDDILERCIEEGIEQFHRTKMSLFLSALAAGLILGFAAMSVCLALLMMPESASPLVKRLGMAVAYPLGFIICIMSGTQLFTEHTSTSVFPVLDRKERITALLKIWMVILTGNLVGTFISTYLIFLADSVIGAREGYILVAHHLTAFSSPSIFISAVLAGWLMAQGGWLVHASSDASAKVLCIYVVTFLIGLGGLHHSIAGSAEIFGALFHSHDPHYYDSFRFIVCAVVGNLFGGSVFVALLNYGHIRKAQ